MNITLYNTSTEKNKLDKDLSTSLGTISGALHERVNALSLSIRVPGSYEALVRESNYVYLDDFDKYYYKESFDIENNTIIINLKQDVLMSYRSEIRGNTATVSRNQNRFNGYMIDQVYQVLAYRGIVAKAFPNSLNDNSIILMTVG